PIVVDDFRNTIAMFGIVDGRCKEVFPWNCAEPLVRLAPAVHCSGDRNAMDAVMRHLFESFAGKVSRREFLRSPATGIQSIKLSCFSVPVDEEEITTHSVHHGLGNAEHGVGRDGGIHRRPAVCQHLSAGLRSQVMRSCDNSTVGNHHGAPVGAILGIDLDDRNHAQKEKQKNSKHVTSPVSKQQAQNYSPAWCRSEFGVFPSESSPNNSLEDQMVCRAGSAPSHTEVELPIGRNIEVYAGKELLLLVGQRIKASDRPERAIVFKASAHHLGKVVRNFRVRGELKALICIQAMKRFIKGWIEGEVPLARLFVDDRANLPGPCVLRKLRPLIAHLVRYAHAHGPVPLFRDSETGPNVITNPVPSIAGTSAGKNIKAGLKPIIHALRDFNGFMNGMVCGRNSIHLSLGTLRGVVGMEFNHRYAGVDRVGAVHLYLVVVLSMNTKSAQAQCQHKKPVPNHYGIETQPSKKLCTNSCRHLTSTVRLRGPCFSP